MSWRRIGPYCLEHERGARIAKVGYARADGAVAFRYLLYGPDRAAGWDYRAWRNGGCGHWSGTEPGVSTQRGERLAQPRRFFGRFPSADAAMAAWAEAQGALGGEEDGERGSAAAEARPGDELVPQGGADDTDRGVSPMH